MLSLLSSKDYWPYSSDASARTQEALSFVKSAQTQNHAVSALLVLVF